MNHNHALHMKLLITIVDRDKGQMAVDLLSIEGVERHYIALGRGTAKTAMLDILGISNSNRDIVFTLLPQEKLHHAIHRLQRAFQLHEPGSGIAFTLSLNSIAKSPLLSFMLGNNTMSSLRSAEKEYPMDVEEMPFDLIIAIVDNDTADDIMDVARSAGARGGTVMRVRGAGIKYAEKFYGITIQPEKEIIFTLVKHTSRKAIMEAMQKAIDSTGKITGIVFSLAADNVTGITPIVFEDDD